MTELRFYGRPARLTVDVDGREVDVSAAVKVTDFGTVTVDVETVLGAIRLAQSYGVGVSLANDAPRGRITLEASPPRRPSDLERRAAAVLSEIGRRMRDRTRRASDTNR